MRLRFLGKESIPGDSPTLYATDHSSYIIQGWKVTDPAILAKLNPSEDEICVEVPAALFAHLVNDGLPGVVASWGPPIVHVTDQGTYIVQSKHVANAEVRAQMTIPEFEDSVEVTRTSITALLLEEDHLGADHK